MNLEEIEKYLINSFPVSCAGEQEKVLNNVPVSILAHTVLHWHNQQLSQQAPPSQLAETNLKKLAMNIVNQLFDLAEVPVDTRQRINDQSDEFVCKLLSEILPAPLQEVSDTATMDTIIDQLVAQLNANDCYQFGLPEEGKRDNLYAILQQRPEVTGWISVDNPPELGEKVIVGLEGDTVLIGRRMSNGWTAFFIDGESLTGNRKVIKWKPLPKF